MSEILPGLSRNLSRAIALGLLVVAIVSFTSLVVLPSISWLFGYGSVFSAAEERYLRFAAIAEERANLDARVEALRNAERDGGYLLSEQDQSTASAALQDQLSELLSRHGIQVTAIRDAGMEDVEGFTLSRVSVSAQIQCNTQQLAEVLVSLETVLPVLTVDQLAIRNLASRPGRETFDDDLRVDLIVSGFASFGSSP